jgi:transposase
MEYGAIDLHARRSQVCIVNEDGQVVLDRRIDTTRADFQRLFGDRAPFRILIESGTGSEWVAQVLEGFGHHVVVVDPNFAAMYGQRRRAVKTDRRDAAALAAACRTGVYRPAHRIGRPTQVRRQQLRIRAQLIRVRTQAINLLRATLRQEGIRLGLGHPESVERRLARLALPPDTAQVLAPIRTMLAQLGEHIAAADRWVMHTAATEPVAQRLMTVPGVGPVIALTFQATLDTPARFGGDPARASAYLGLVPAEYSSGERQHKGRITKAGPPTIRALLVQAAWAVWRRPGAAGATLHAWVRRLADRRGRRIAIVALARRLSRILFAVWRDDCAFVPAVG